MEKLDKSDGQSMDIMADNIAKLKELFPEILTENKIDFDTLKALLGEEIEVDDERYSFNWNGKAQARRLAQSPSTGTLRPSKEDSVDWDTTQNLFIEGDNLEVLKLLQKSYHKQVKMIYIDPPYNTGSDFVYHDNFKDSIQNYLELTGQVASGKKVGTNTESSGRYHTDWLNMMYPRLKLARNLLRDDGVIAIHIDENEYTNLEKLLSEIFGESNNLGTIVWDKRNPKGEVAGVAQQHELISLFCKNTDAFAASSYFSRKKENAGAMLNKAAILIKSKSGVTDEVRSLYRQWLKEREHQLSGGESAYNQLDESGDVYQPVSMAAPDRPETRSHRPLIHPVTGKPCPVPAKGWRYPDSTMDELLRNGRVIFGHDENTQPRRKYLLRENIRESVSSLLYFGGSDDALGLPFDNPKPIAVATKLIESICKPGELVMDFFAGSSTTAHAAMQLNTEDDGKRQFIMVQLPESCDEKSEAYKAGYKTIAEISKERIRRAGQKIQSENSTYQGDLGFKVFKLDSSNLKPWDADFDSLAQDLAEATEVVKAERKSEDVLFEILLKYGLDLTLPIATHTLEGKTVYEVGVGALVVCLDSGITEAVAEAIGKLKETLEPEVMRVVFKDSGFANDAAKVNAVQVLKQFGIDDVKSI